MPETTTIPPAPNPTAATSARPDGVREGSETLVRLTPAAGAKAATLMQREQQGGFLRIAISGGGCNGLSYKMRFVPEPKRGDIVVRTAGIAVLVDSRSALYLKGTAAGLFGGDGGGRLQVLQSKCQGQLLLRGEF